MIDRRSFLAGALGAFAATDAPLSASEVAALRFGPASPLSFNALKQRARDLARAPYIPPTRPAPEVLQQIDYDAHGKIKFKTDLALWANGPRAFPVTLFHLGRYFQLPVRMHVVEAGRRARSSTTAAISTCR